MRARRCPRPPVRFMMSALARGGVPAASANEGCGGANGPKRVDSQHTGLDRH
jgi:hypothetical protein